MTYIWIFKLEETCLVHTCDTRMNESWHMWYTYEWVMAHVYEWVMAHVIHICKFIAYSLHIHINFMYMSLVWLVQISFENSISQTCQPKLHDLYMNMHSSVAPCAHMWQFSNGNCTCHTCERKLYDLYMNLHSSGTSARVQSQIWTIYVAYITYWWHIMNEACQIHENCMTYIWICNSLKIASSYIGDAIF